MTSPFTIVDVRSWPRLQFQTILGEFLRGYNFKARFLPPGDGRVEVKPQRPSPVPERLLRASRCWPRGGEQAIKGVHRRLALMYHPDRNPGEPRDEEKFKEATCGPWRAACRLVERGARMTFWQAAAVGSVLQRSATHLRRGYQRFLECLSWWTAGYSRISSRARR